MCKCCQVVSPINSARNFANPAPVLSHKSVIKLLRSHHGGRALEIGAGCLRNARYLLSIDFQVDILEVSGMEARFPEQYEAFQTAGGRIIKTIPSRKKYDLAIGTFVFETICSPEVRLRLLRETRAALKIEGSLILSVRGPGDLLTAVAKGQRCSDGFVTPGKTFARSYTREQLKRLLRSAGYGRTQFLHKQSTKAPELLHAMVKR
jgi:hypothetical protein